LEEDGLTRSTGQTSAVATESITPNPKNPRLYFNDDRLDQLRTSVQEVGVLVPLIVYEDPDAPGQYVLMDGERRWRCALDLGLDSVPVNVIPPASSVENLLRMFNILERLEYAGNLHGWWSARMDVPDESDAGALGIGRRRRNDTIHS
jgi:ParB/RepB/Spo0J family partition protein